MNIVIFGPPGAGKGTQSSLIVKKFKLFQLSTGELLRKEIKNNTSLGKKISLIINKGNLVSDEIVGSLIEKYVYQHQIIFTLSENSRKSTGSKVPTKVAKNC